MRHVYDRSTLYHFNFDQKGNNAFQYVIDFAVEKACLDEPVRGIKALLEGAQSECDLQHELHSRMVGFEW